MLDEAQNVKNPSTEAWKAARQVKSEQRLALTGTPIENRLLDLWSIMNFAMPGVLGLRSRFAKTYDQKEDPLARRRLAGRVRPFVLRRTKEQVAKDLPARIEEDLLCEMEGKQATLYRAELKRARQALLKLKTDKELDKARFNILTSLLRLRQICCHPKLVDANAADEPSAKVEALMEMLEPLLEEGRKVLVFSQFVGVLEILQAEIQKREWKHFILTGQTENRGALIADFQESAGAAVFLLSLKASGFGLNLTASSYVVLFDPWWNPAVENQAIDRAHRIGQKDTVFAYRLLVKGSIEEKIRALQTQKRALAADVLGEEAFAKALTLDDLRSLLEEPA
jgi:SNF2 family DNA or RNA helicase